MVAGSDIVSYAMQQRGDPYVFGAEGPDAFDCSGLVEYVYKRFGLTTPRTTFDMIGSKSNLQSVTRAQLQPGDLIFSNWIGKPSSHVGIFAGDGKIIEAPEPGKSVMVTNLGPNYWAHVDQLRRVPGVDGSPGTMPVGASPIPGPGGMLMDGANILSQLIPNPGNVTDALTNVGTGIASVAMSAASVGTFAAGLTKLFLPSNLLRAWALVMGTVFVLVGIWFLAREVKDS